MQADVITRKGALSSGFKYTVFRSVSDLKSFETLDCTWDELVDKIKNPKTYASKAACPLIKLAAFGDRGNANSSLRHDDNVDLVYGVEGDYDANEVTPAEGAARLRIAGVRAVIYTSATHGVVCKKNPSGGPRWRVLAPLSGPVAPALRHELLSLLNGVLGGILGDESWVLSQTYYFGRVKGVQYESHVVDGECLDVHALCPAFDPIDPPKAARAAAKLAAPRRKQDADTAEIAHLRSRRLITLERPDGAVDVLCPRWEMHGTEGATSGSTWFPAGVGGRSEGGFECRHTSCGKPTTSEFLNWSGLDKIVTARTIDEFEHVEVADDPEQAAIRAKNADKPPRVVLETQRDRSIRIGREGDHVAPGQRIMTGSEMLEELIYIARGAQVSFIAQPRTALPFDEFKRLTAGSVEFAKSAAGRANKAHRAQLWLESKDRKTVTARTFAPGRAGVCQSPDDELSQNLWVPRVVDAPSNWAELAAPFFEHVAYLVPIAAERERFLDWLAHIEQQPGVLPSTHYLMVARQTGIGRNWMAYALARAFPGHAALGFDLGQALRSGFNGALGQKLLAVVDELHEGGPGGAHTPAAEKLKSMLTEATRLINPKHGRQHIEFNCVRFLMFSNHAAALPLADNDRRVIVIENPSERRSEAYFAELYALLDAPSFGPALAEALKRRDISAFNPGAPAPMTEAKARTIRAGRSEVEQAVRDVASEWASACITSSRLTHVVGEALGGKTWNVQSACVAAGLVKYDGRHRVDGVQSHIWILRDQAEWRDAQPQAIVSETERGQNADNVKRDAEKIEEFA